MFPDYFVIAKHPAHARDSVFSNGSDKEHLYGKNYWH